MALQNGEPNPLDYFKCRQVPYPCPQFSYISINSSLSTTDIKRWVIQNLYGRFYIGQDIMLDSTNTIVYNTRIGFENEEEISFFIIGCPHYKM
jgi:hypothetical protein